MKFSEFIVKDAIIPELKAHDRDGVIRELVQALAKSKALAEKDVDAIVKAIIDREKHGSTGFGKGVAVPHVKHPALKKRSAAIGRSTVSAVNCSSYSTILFLCFAAFFAKLIAVLAVTLYTHVLNDDAKRKSFSL